MKNKGNDKKMYVEKVLIPQQRVKHKILIKGFKKKRINTKETVKRLLAM